MKKLKFKEQIIYFPHYDQKNTKLGLRKWESNYFSRFGTIDSIRLTCKL